MDKEISELEKLVREEMSKLNGYRSYPSQDVVALCNVIERVINRDDIKIVTKECWDTIEGRLGRKITD